MQTNDAPNIPDAADAPVYALEATRYFLQRQTDWLQDSRLMSEAIFALNKQHSVEPFRAFHKGAWPRRNSAPNDPQIFQMAAAEVDSHLSDLSFKLWESRFIFLETLWESYLADLVTELSHTSASFFEDAMKDTSIAPEIIRYALTGKYGDLSELRLDVSVVFSERTTRASFTEQWKKLRMLLKALPADVSAEKWYGDLEVYFCMRNCVIHRRSRVSHELAARSSFYENMINREFRIYAGHLDYYRHAFIGCVSYIDQKLSGYLTAMATQQGASNGN
jgi:hypothetical protein